MSRPQSRRKTNPLGFPYPRRSKHSRRFRALTIESLERRQLLATIAWDGDAGDNNWNTAANWVGNVLPGGTDDVQIGIAFRDSTIIHAVASGVRSLTNEATLRLLPDPSSFASLTVTDGLTNHGTIELTSTSSGDVRLTVEHGTLVNSARGRILSLQGGGGLRSIFAQLDNSGTLTIESPTTVNGSFAGGQTNHHFNQGTIKVMGGDLTVNQASMFTNSGQIHVETGRAFTIDGNYQGGQLSDGYFCTTVHAAGATLTGGGQIIFAGGKTHTVRLDDNLTLSADGPELAFVGQDVQVRGGAGRLINHRTLDVTGAYIDSPLDNQGIIEVHPNLHYPYSGSQITSLTTSMNSTLRVLPEAQLRVGGFVNNGTLELDSYRSTGLTAGFTVVGGLTNSVTGTIRSGGIIHAVRIDNFGTLNASQGLELLSGGSDLTELTNSGRIVLDTSTFRVRGNVTFNNQSQLSSSIAGTQQLGQVIVFGTLTLGGTIDLIFDNTYAPKIEDSFEIIANAGINGLSPTPTVGTFNGLAEGARFFSGPSDLQITYKGGSGDDVDLTVVGTNSRPVADAGGPYSVDEGSRFTLDASVTFDADEFNSTLTYEWDLNYDGTAFNVDARGIGPLVPVPDNFLTRQIAVRVTDSGGVSSLATSTIKVSNVAPALRIVGRKAITEGGVYTLNLSSKDPGQDLISQWQIDWGDGSKSQVVTSTSATGRNPSFFANHIYSKGPNSYTIRATAADDDGTFDSNTLKVVVNPVGPLADLTSFQRPAEGRIVSAFAPQSKSPQVGVSIGGKNKGKSITAAASGKVVFAAFQGSNGNTIIIDHGYDESGSSIKTFYLHAAQLFVKAGEAVSRGQSIGTVGATGKLSSGKPSLKAPRLDFLIQRDDGWVNPRFSGAFGASKDQTTLLKLESKSSGGNQYNGLYEATFTGTRTLNGQMLPVSGSVQFRVKKGQIVVTEPARGTGSISDTGLGKFNARGSNL